MPIDIKDLHECDKCGGTLTGENKNCPVFEVVRFSQAVLDAGAINRHLGMAQMMGGGNVGMTLANVMGPGEPAARIVAEEDGDGWNEAFLCQDCFLEIFGEIVERVMNRKEEAKERAS
ncbi:hypothetical protein LCGC14_1584010 [marine sediment metagenome]|uniref:Uncharacterized protein n=1 Tax=marine sediment metagenome TaxID=412755 RepID=A0A0F9IG97_9ZZZZ